MNIDHIEAFIRVVDLRSVRKAAGVMYLSQPTVTARIQRLEQELGTKLFSRKGRELAITKEGEAFIPFAQQIVEALEEGKALLKQKPEDQEILIGATPLIAQYFIPAVLPHWRKRWPDLRFRFMTGTNEQLAAQLLYGSMAMAFLEEAAHEDIQTKPILDNSLQLVSRSDHPLRKGKEFLEQLLAKEPVILYEHVSEHSNILQQNFFKHLQVDPLVETVADQPEAVKNLIKSGAGVGILPRLALDRELANNEMNVLDIGHIQPFEQSIYAARHVSHHVPIWEEAEAAAQYYLNTVNGEKAMNRIS